MIDQNTTVQYSRDSRLTARHPPQFNFHKHRVIFHTRTKLSRFNIRHAHVNIKHWSTSGVAGEWGSGGQEQKKNLFKRQFEEKSCTSEVKVMVCTSVQ